MLTGKAGSVRINVYAKVVRCSLAELLINRQQKRTQYRFVYQSNRKICPQFGTRQVMMISSLIRSKMLLERRPEVIGTFNIRDFDKARSWSAVL